MVKLFHIAAQQYHKHSIILLHDDTLDNSFRIGWFTFHTEDTKKVLMAQEIEHYSAGFLFHTQFSNFTPAKYSYPHQPAHIKRLQRLRRYQGAHIFMGSVTIAVNTYSITVFPYYLPHPTGYLSTLCGGGGGGVQSTWRKPTTLVIAFTCTLFARRGYKSH